MRIVITQNVTLDGVIEVNEATGDWFGPAVGDPDMSDLESSLKEMMAEEQAMIFGRKTFEEMRSFWPDQPNDVTGVADHLNQVDKYVVTTTMTDPKWQNSTILHGDMLEAIRELKSQPGLNLGVTGSISVCHALIAADLVDEYRLFVYPSVIGQARRLFDDDAARPHNLELVNTRQFQSGIALLTYRPSPTADSS